MLKELSLVELTVGKKNTSSKGIYKVSGGRSEMPGGQKRNKNGKNESKCK